MQIYDSTLVVHTETISPNVAVWVGKSNFPSWLYIDGSSAYCLNGILLLSKYVNIVICANL